jgi:glycerol-3-phosphate acyltransferase PlsY
MPWIEQLQSANWREGTCIFFGAYSLGCFTTGYYLVRLCQDRDIRTLGSGNVGAKNVGRLLGWAGYLVTMLGDSAKGALAVWAALAGLAMLAVVTGHVWPAQLRFRGGKGAATSVGALLILDPRLAVAFSVLFIISLAVLRRWILAGMIAFATLPLAAKYLEQEPRTVVLTSFLAGLVMIAHRKNLLAELWHFIQRPNLPAKHHPPEL